MTVLTGKVITSSSEVKLLGITIDYDLKFQKHDINTDVPQGSMLGLLLFNVFIFYVILQMITLFSVVTKI